MKSKVLPLLAAATLVAASAASADTFTWNTAGASNNWNTIDANWTSVSSGNVWVDGNDAVFNAATGETVSLVGSLSATSTTFGTGNGAWTLNGTGSLSGGALTKSGTGTLTLSNTTANTFSSVAITNGGLTVSAGSNGALGSSAAPIALTAGGVNVTLTVNAVSLANTGILTMTSTGTGRSQLVLGNAVSGTAVTFANNISLKTSANTTGFASISSAGNSSANAAIVSGNISFASTADAGDTAAKNTVQLRGAGGFGKVTGYIDLLTNNTSNLAALRLNDSSTSWELKGASGNATTAGNRWSLLEFNAGTGGTQNLYVDATNTLSSEGVVTSVTSSLGTNNLRLTNMAGTTSYSQAIAGLNDSAATAKVNVTSAQAATLTIGGSGTYSTVGVISGAVAIAMNGAGSQTLAGINTYTGGTTVTAGTLTTGNSSALGSGAVAVNGGSLVVGATGVSGIASLTVSTGALNTTTGAVTTTGAFALSGGTWTVGATANGMTSGSFNLTGGLIDLALLSAFDKQNSGFSLISGTGDASSLTNANFVNGDAAFSYGLDTNGDLVVTAVPEPSTYGLIGAGALAALSVVRRRRKHAVDVA